MQSPVEIRKEGNSGVMITWKDGERTFLSSIDLRLHCPCALCKESRGDTSHSSPLKPANKKPRSLNILTSSREEETSIEKIWPVGNYAIGIRWADRHESGIYTFAYLYELGRQNQ